MDHIDDTEARPETMIVGGQTAGIGAYMHWKDGSWPDRQGGTRKKDFLDGYGEALRRVAKLLGADGLIEAAVKKGQL